MTAGPFQSYTAPASYPPAPVGAGLAAAGFPLGKKAKTAIRWRKMTEFMTIGYESMGRTFSYLGFVPLSLFIGEICLGWFALTRHDAITYFLSGAKRNRAVELIRYSFLAFILFGVVSLFNGFLNRQGGFAALQNFAFNYYAFYLIIGLWTALKNPPFLKRFAIIFGWFHAIYGTAYVLFLNRLPWYIPGTAMVQWFGQPNGAGVAILFLLSYERRFSKIFWPCILNLFVMFGVQVRSEWVGFIIAFLAWSILSKKMSQFMGFISVLVLLGAMGMFFNFKMEGISNRGGEVSVNGVIGRMIAPFNLQLASHFVDDPESLGGTARWREEWWHQIWLSINHGDQRTFLIGH
ncbi:MAG: hypothetical protein JO353_12515, partial [Phycisphaerae bacterium]|nr:hypothetical protein [Phycisphaerae bacterium]